MSQYDDNYQHTQMHTNVHTCARTHTHTRTHNYHTVKTLAGETLDEFGKLQQFVKLFANFHNFHNIPYANGLQFTKDFSVKLPTVFIRQTFLPPKVFYYTIAVYYSYIARGQ